MKKVMMILMAGAIGMGAYAQNTERLTEETRMMETEDGEDMSESVRENIERQKMAYLSNELQLTEKEASAFWPLYQNQMKEKQMLREAGREMRMKSKEMTRGADMSSFDQIMQARFQNQREAINIDERFFKSMSTVLPAEKVIGFYKAEKDFKREMMRTMNERRYEKEGMAPEGRNQGEQRRTKGAQNR